MENGSDKSTQALVEGAMEGDAEAFARLVDRYRDAASAVAYSYLGGFDDVQDAVQESFVHAYCHLRQLREPAKFGPWLRRITANSCAMALRKRERSNVSLEEVGEQQSISDDAGGTAAREVVREALGKLSDATRLTVTLSYIDGYSHAEVAEFMEVPLTTVRSRLRHAKRKLREEMIEMVSNVLHEDKPGEELARKILGNVTRAEKAMQIGANDQALQLCDDAMAAFRDLKSSRTPDQVREVVSRAIESDSDYQGNKEQALNDLRTWTSEEIQFREEVEILLRKGEVLLQVNDLKGAEEVFEEAKEVAKVINNPGVWSKLIGRIAHDYHNAHQGVLAREHLAQMVEAARNTGDAFGEAMNVWALANTHMDEAQPTAARPLYERACALFLQAGRPARAAMAQAAVDLIHELGEINSASVVRLVSFCLALRRAESSVEVTDKGGGWVSKPVEAPWAFHIAALGGEGRILDTAVPVGGSWKEGDSWLTNGPMDVTHAVLGYDETVVTTRTTYSGCALMETLTIENKLPDNMSDELKAQLRSHTGSIRKWYAPGIGLVRVVAANSSGDSSIIELQDYNIVEPGNDYLPLAVDNSWTYSWVDALKGYIAKERYRVAANDGEHWYLEHYKYVLK